MNNTEQCNIHNNSYGPFSIMIYSCTFAIGLPLNIIALCGLYQVKNQSGLLVTYVLNLIISDLCSLMTLPLWIMYQLNQVYWVYGEVSCRITDSVFYINIYAGVYFLNWTAIDRYLAIVHPLLSRGMQTKKVAVIISLCGWLFCSAGGIIFVLLLQFEELCFEMHPPFKMYAVLRLIFICFGFFLPCVILCFTYGSTLQAIQRSTSLEPDEKKCMQQLLPTVSFIFLVFFGPYHIVYSYRIIVLLSVADICYHESSIALYLYVTLAIMSLNNISVAVLYIFVCRDFQRSLYTCDGWIKPSAARICCPNCLGKLINGMFLRNRGNSSCSEQRLHQNPAN